MEQDTQVLVVLALGIVVLCVIARCSGRKLSAAEQIAFGLLVGGALVPAIYQKPTPQANAWTVPIRRRGGSIMLDGQVDGRLTVHWMLDTGASTTFIPRDLAKAMDAQELRRKTFVMADGRKVTMPIVLIKRLKIGNVTVTNLAAAVGDAGTDPLLGKNFLDAFSSYEINNKQAQLVLRK